MSSVKQTWTIASSEYVFLVTVVKSRSGDLIFLFVALSSSPISALHSERDRKNLLKLFYMGRHLYPTAAAFVGNFSQSQIQKIIFSNIPLSVIL